MKLQTVALAIATVLTLAQSAEANECKVINIIQQRAELVGFNYKKSATEAAFAGRDSSYYNEMAERYQAVANLNNAYMEDKGCEYVRTKPTAVEAFMADEAIKKLDKMLQR